MTVTLCIDTSGPHCSLALAADDEIYVEQRLLERSHNLHLLPMLEGLFVRGSLAPGDVEVVAFGNGPGSFTGVRIAAAVTQAVAFSAEALVLPVASSRVLALTAAQKAAQTGADSDAWLCCLPSRGSTYYVSAYRLTEGLSDGAQHGQNDGGLEELHPDELVESPPMWFASMLENIGKKASGEPRLRCIGTAPPWLPAPLQTVFIEGLYPCAAAMVGFARQCHANGQCLPPEQALPRYVAGDSPWHKRKASDVRGG